jgi:predicted RNA-binding protein YlxR (DUF448 family)
MRQGMRRSRHRRRATTEPALAPPDDADPPDSDDDAPESGPLRRCAVTRARLAKERMIRFVIGPDRAVVPDLAERLPGRGIWLSAALDVVETARRRGAFAKAARGPVTVPPDLLEMLQAALVRRISEALGLARRAGQAVAGFEKAREWLRDGRAGLVVQAADGSAEERVRFLSGARRSVAVHAPLSAAALGAVFGRDRAVHVVLAPGALAERIGRDCTRLAGLAPGLAANDKAVNDTAVNDKVDPANLRQRGVRDE